MSKKHMTQGISVTSAALAKTFSIASIGTLLFAGATVSTVSGCAAQGFKPASMNSVKAQKQNNDAVIMSQAKSHFVRKNYREALPLLQYLAKRRNDEAQYALGYMYYYGIGVTADREAAVTWMQLAAAKNNKRAQIALERHYAMNDASHSPTMVGQIQRGYS